MIISMALPLARPPQNRLEIPFTQVTGADLAALAACPWWRELVFLQASFANLKEAANWRDLWSGPDLAFEEVRLCYPNTKCAIEVIRGPLAHLRVLALCGEIGDEFLQELAGASLPELEDLEIRKTNTTAAAVRDFAHSKHPGLPRLKRLGISFASDRREDYTDWNGALVDWGYAPMNDAELQYDILGIGGLKLMPTIYGWPQ